MIKLKVNGKNQQFDGDADTPLLWVLRDELILRERSSVAAWAYVARVRCT